MQAIVETVFDVVYLITVITLGIRMVQKSKGQTQFRLFGYMAIVLGRGRFLPIWFPVRWRCAHGG